MNLIDYAQAGYDARISERPPYDSSPAGMAFAAGEWCRSHGIYPLECRMSRGHSIRINRDVILNCNGATPVLPHA